VSSDPSMSPDPPPPPAGESPPAGLPVKILIADDNEAIRNTIAAVLQEQQGWCICGFAKDGAEAVRKTAELQPHIVLLDLAMPVMDGFRAAQEITSQHPEVFVVMVTQYCSTSLRAEALKQGVREVINKSDLVDYLVHTLQAIARDAQSRGASAGGT
jgi:DNA-binding NarL/FixJ family response regulator